MFTEYSILLLNTINIGLAQHAQRRTSCVDHKPNYSIYGLFKKIPPNCSSEVFLRVHSISSTEVTICVINLINKITNKAYICVFSHSFCHFAPSLP